MHYVIFDYRCSSKGGWEVYNNNIIIIIMLRKIMIQLNYI